VQEFSVLFFLTQGVDPDSARRLHIYDRETVEWSEIRIRRAVAQLHAGNIGVWVAFPEVRQPRLFSSRFISSLFFSFSLSPSVAVGQYTQ